MTKDQDVIDELELAYDYIQYLDPETGLPAGIVTNSPTGIASLQALLGANVGNTTVSWSTYRDLSAGDEIDVYAAGSGAWYSNGADNYTYWGGYLIG